MLYRDIEDCEQCPLYKEEICPGGMTSVPCGIPIDPPCSCFDDDTDLDKWVSDYFDYQRKREQQERVAYANKLIKQQKAALAKRKRNYLKIYCTHEHLEVNAIKKRIKACEKIISYAESMVFAINTTNEMFNYSERVSTNKQYTDELTRLQTALADAEQRLKQKQCEGRKTAEYKAIK